MHVVYSLRFMFSESFFTKVCFGFLFLFYTATIVLLFLQNSFSPTFSTDSWGYFDISKSIFHNFYQVSYVRQYQVDPQYGISFPPLYPFVIAIGNTFWHLGIYSGYIFNGFIAIATLCMLLLLSKRITSFALPGFVMFLALFSHKDYVGELVSARSIPLTIFLLCVWLFVFLRRKLSKVHIIILGILAGLLALNRFDFFIPGILLGVPLLWNTQIAKTKAVIFYYACFFLAISPWIIYSLMHFHTLYISDNERTVFLAFRSSTLDYFPASAHVQSLFTSPVRWTLYRVLFIGSITLYAFVAMVYYNPVVQQLLWSTVFLFFAYSLIDKYTKHISFDSHRIWYFKTLLILFPMFFFQLYTISLTGFSDMRYGLVFLLYSCLLLLAIVIVFAQQMLKRKHLSILVSLVTLLWVSSYIFNSFSEQFSALTTKHIGLNQNIIRPDKQFSRIADELRKKSDSPIILVHGRGDKAIYAEKFGSLTGIRTLEEPGNVNNAILVDVVKQYHVTHVQTSCHYWISTLKQHFVMEKTATPYLYYIKGKKQSPRMSKDMQSIYPDEKFKDCIGAL